MDLLETSERKIFLLVLPSFRVTCCLQNVFMNKETAGFSKTLATAHQATGVTQTITF
jgi:hypothetical protein